MTLLRLAAVAGSALLLSAGWLGLTGLTLLAAFVPLLWLSGSYDATRRSWWRVFGWALLAFVLWNVLTVWWIGYATPVGPVAATLASTTLNMLAFMSFHTVSKRGPKALAYTLLVAGWITTEYWYTVGEFSWPWLILGNGFSHDVRLVQWYEITGVFGGSLWVLVTNILLYEALRRPRSRSRWLAAGAAVLLPMGASLVRYATWRPSDEGTVRVAIAQPNVNCYDKFHTDASRQERNIVDLLSRAPRDAQFLLFPETAVPRYYWEPELGPTPATAGRRGGFWLELADSLRASHPATLLVTGANTNVAYAPGERSRTARRMRDGSWYDHYNTAVGLDASGAIQLHHKGRLVIGVEKTPTWLFDWFDFLVIDLGGTLGQLGVGTCGTVFTHDGVRVGPAICYEGLYGDFFGDFVRRGAQAMFLISNDGWWGDTPGYRHLFTISRLRAVEHRRAIARSANTGRSGFIDARGDVHATLGWEERGLLADEMRLDSRLTFYTRYGDWAGRAAEYVALLSVLTYAVYRVRRRNHLVP